MTFAMVLLRCVSTAGRLRCLASRQQKFLASGVTETVKNEKGTSSKKQAGSAASTTEHVQPTSVDVPEEQEEPEVEMVEMWNKDAPSGPEWNGPRGYEPTRYGDWSTAGRVSDF